MHFRHCISDGSGFFAPFFLAFLGNLGSLSFDLLECMRRGYSRRRCERVSRVMPPDRCGNARAANTQASNSRREGRERGSPTQLPLSLSAVRTQPLLLLPLLRWRQNRQSSTIWATFPLLPPSLLHCRHTRPTRTTEVRQRRRFSRAPSPLRPKELAGNDMYKSSP